MFGISFAFILLYYLFGGYMNKTILPLLSIGIIPLMFACSDSSVMMSGDRAAEEDGAWDTGVAAAPNADQESDSEFDDGLGSEEESDFLALRPATTDAYVFVANPDRNTVTRISVPSLEVMTVEVGVEPLIVETSADYTRAITFNKGSNSISVINSETLEVTDIEIRKNLNQMKMSSDGNWAICYHDVNAEGGGASSGGAISFNAISIINLENQTQFEAMAGSYPHDVQYSEDGSFAVVISDDYLSVIDLTEDAPSPSRIAISDDLINPPRAEEVLLDPNGGKAIVRQYGVDVLKLVTFETGLVQDLPSGENPTDMDSSPDGLEAIVVTRTSKEIWRYSWDDPEFNQIVDTLPENEVFGSLLMSPDGSQGMVYSTVSGESTVGIWDPSTGETAVRGLVKPVSNVGVSPTGETAIVFHPESNGDTPSTSQFYNHFALSLVDLGDLFTTAYLLDGEPTSFASTPDGEIGFYTMENQPFLELLNYQTFVPTEIRLPSNPVHLGTLPDTNTAFVSQEHDLGRISFFNTDEDELQTITGFELNAAIEQ
jgi:DNA-binding beta-propeller fold protein YncE